MPPDTTQTLVDALAHFKDRLDVISTLLSIIGGGGLVGLIGLLVKGFAWLKQWRDRRALRKGLGATPYGSQEIERATHHYVRPQCQSIDPAQGQEIRTVYASREDLFSAVDRLLNEPTESKYLILLADSGMGKTSFVLNYYARHLRRWRKPFRLQVVPLGFKDADKLIRKISEDDKDAVRDTVLVLDALDEDTLAIVDHRERLLNLCDATAAFRNVLITCRTQFFPRAVEEPRRTGVVKLTPIPAGHEGEYLFHKLYLSPFDDRQVAQYLRRRYPIWRWRKRRRARKVANKIPQLTARPMLLAHIDDLLAKDRNYAHSFQLYEEMVGAWLAREEKRVEGLRQEPLREFCERLAVELFVQRKEQGGERLPYEAIEPLAQKFELDKKFGIKLEGWKLSGRSLLNRDAEDSFKFAHRSIMEYLFVKRFLVMPVAERPELPWTDQMKRFLLEMVHDQWERNRQVQFNLAKVDLNDMGRLQAKLLFKFRSNRKTLGEGEAKRMIKEFGFFDSSWNNDGYGIFHLYQACERESEKIIIDYARGLFWQQSGSANSMNYADAEKYIHDLNEKRFAGYNDWRLPTLEEAMSLMEREKKNGDLYIDLVFDRTQGYIWTADKESAGRAWFVDFLYGPCYHNDIGDVNSVRAVRS